MLPLDLATVVTRKTLFSGWLRMVPCYVVGDSVHA